MRRGTVETGRWYDVRIEQQGDNVKVWLDDELLFDTPLKHNTSQGIYSSATVDETTGKVIVKVVNTRSEDTTANLNVKGKSINKVRLTRLSSANGTDENTMGYPTAVYPTEESVNADGDHIQLYVPANSLNIVTID